MTELATEEEVVEEAEVVELPANAVQLTERLNELREEIAQITNVITANQKELDTRMAAFHWYTQQLQNAIGEPNGESH